MLTVEAAELVIMDGDGQGGSDGGGGGDDRRGDRADNGLCLPSDCALDAGKLSG